MEMERLRENCDAELVLQAVRDFYENNFEKMIIISSDGDFGCLIQFLQEMDKLELVLAQEIRTSALASLKACSKDNILARSKASDSKGLKRDKWKAPTADKPQQELFEVVQRSYRGLINQVKYKEH